MDVDLATAFSENLRVAVHLRKEGIKHVFGDTVLLLTYDAPLLFVFCCLVYRKFMIESGVDSKLVGRLGYGFGLDVISCG